MARAQAPDANPNPNPRPNPNPDLSPYRSGWWARHRNGTEGEPHALGRGRVRVRVDPNPNPNPSPNPNPNGTEGNLTRGRLFEVEFSDGILLEDLAPI